MEDIRKTSSAGVGSDRDAHGHDAPPPSYEDSTATATTAMSTSTGMVVHGQPQQTLPFRVGEERHRQEQENQRQQQQQRDREQQQQQEQQRQLQHESNLQRQRQAQQQQQEGRQRQQQQQQQQIQQQQLQQQLQQQNSSMTSQVPAQRRQLPPPPPLDLPVLNLLRGKRVILASASPRRRQLLAQIGLTNLEIIPSSFAENLPKTLAPFEYVLATATQKALAVYASEINNTTKGEPALIIAADTIVVTSHGEILEKPRSEAHHVAMLTSLRDSGSHKVYTAVACVVPLESARDPGYALETATEETVVKFDRGMSDQMLRAYVKTREGVDKAGGYGIQGIGAVLVEGIEGSFDNVVGLPLRTTLGVIERAVRLGMDDDGDVDGDSENGEIGEEE